MLTQKKYIGLTFKISILFVFFGWLLTSLYLMLTYGQAFTNLNQSFEKQVELNLLWSADLLELALTSQKKELTAESVPPLLKRLQMKTDADNLYLLLQKKNGAFLVFSALPLPLPTSETKIARALRQALTKKKVTSVADSSGKWAFAPLSLKGADAAVCVYFGWQNIASQWEGIKTRHILFFLFVMVLSLLSGLILSIALTRPIRQLLIGLKRVEKGDLEHRIREFYLLGIPIEDELSEMTKVFNQMTQNLQQKNIENRSLYEEINTFNRELTSRVKEATKELEAANQKLLAQKAETDRDLRLARGIQMALLPKSLKLPTVTIEARCFPAFDVSGDFYAFFPLDVDTLALIIGDVSGRGIAASLLMSFVYGVFLEAAHRKLPPAEALALVNEALYRHTLSENPQFVTATYGTYHIPTRTLCMANAGHYAPFLSRKGKVEPLPIDGPLLGVFSNVSWEVLELPLSAEDLLIFFTDGIIEAKNPKGERLLLSGLQKTYLRNRTLPLEKLVDKMMDDVLDYMQSEHSDDMALMTVKIEHSAKEA